MRSKLRHWFVILALGIGVATPGAAQEGSKPTDSEQEAETGLFLYVDDKGQLHLVDRVSLIPAEYRRRAWRTKDGKPDGPLDETQPARNRNKYPASDNSPGARHSGTTARSTAPTAKPDDAGRTAPSSTGREQTSSRTTDQAEPSIKTLRQERRKLLEEMNNLEVGFAEREGDADTLARRIDSMEERLSWLDKEIARRRSGP